MYKDKIGESYEYKGVVYTVGNKIIGAKRSEYDGVVGVIKEITDEDDALEIICDFEDPTDPEIIKRMEEYFSKIFGKPMTLNDISLEGIIMCPDEIDFLCNEE